MRIKKQKKILNRYALVSIVFLTALVATTAIKAAVNGWGWGGSEDLTTFGTVGVVDGNESGLGWISLNSADAGAGGRSYAVNVPSSGAVTGYAWSENMGWIDFNPQDHCITTGTPTSAQYKAASCTAPSGGGMGGVFSSANTLTGWARFVNIAEASAIGNSGGWDGWIGIGVGNGFDVSFDPATSKISGFAWSELGAIDFSSKTKKLVVCAGTCDNGAPVANKDVRNIAKEDTAYFAACNTTSDSCQGQASDDVTAVSTWAESDSPKDVISIKAKGEIFGKDAGKEGVKVSYKDPNRAAVEAVSFEINVTKKDCSCDAVKLEETCSSAPKFADACNNADSCTGTKDCIETENWIEVAP